MMGIALYAIQHNKKLGVLQMKRGFFCVLFFVFLLGSVAHATKSYPPLPPYTSKVLSNSELDTFFETSGLWYDDTRILLESVYSNMENTDETVYGMVFKAEQNYDQAMESGYGTWHADFVVTATKKVWIWPAGNYGLFGTVPSPVPVLLEAGKPVRVLEYAGLGDWTYADVVQSVEEFQCVAIPITTEFLKAYSASGGKMEDLPSGIFAAPPDVRIGLSQYL